MSDTNAHEHENDDLTQGENPGAQGDIGAGQATPGDDPVVTDPEPTLEGDEQPRRAEQFDDMQADDMQIDDGQFGSAPRDNPEI